MHVWELCLQTLHVYTKLEETKSRTCVAPSRASPHLPSAAWQVGDSFTHGKLSVLMWYGSWAAYSPAVQRCLLVIQTGVGISNPSLTDHVSNETIFSAQCVALHSWPHPLGSLLFSDRLDLATARATSVVLSVRVSVQRHTNQQLVRATIGALVLGCPPLGNSRTRSYHAIGR